MNPLKTDFLLNNSDGSEHESETGDKYQSDQEETEVVNGKNEESHSDYDEDFEENYNMGTLPLEVITTVEPTNYAYPVLKNMSNGVLTHRNIFTESERLVLKDIINKYRNIVDTRSRTREIFLEKQNVWQQIVEEYNSAENIMVRTEKELRKCWDNMKYRAKQACNKKIEKTEFTENNSIQEAENPIKAFIDNGNIKEEFEECVVGNESTTNTKPTELISIKKDIFSDPEENQLSGEKDCIEKEDNFEDGEPELKRARQESPKLSSLLLAGPKKTKEKKTNLLNIDKNGNFPFNIPSCTNIYNVKKDKNNTQPSNGIPILPKGLSSCLSITNIPNPFPQIPTTVPSNTLPDPALSSFPSSPDVNGQVKPLPNLKKMLHNKNLTQSLGSRIHKSVNKNMLVNLDNDVEITNGFSNKDLLNSSKLERLIGPVSNEVEDSDQSLNVRLQNQRLKFERIEHEAKMKLHEKEMQVKNYEAQYWALKLKLLRAGKDFNHNINGDFI